MNQIQQINKVDSSKNSLASKIVQGVKSFNDGWANLLTGFGIRGRDKTKSTTHYRGQLMTKEDQYSLYMSDGFARRTVELMVREMTRRGFKIEGDTDGLILKYYKKKKFDIQVRRMLKWSKIFGGGLGVMIIDDGNDDLEQPLNENNIRKIEQIKVYHRWQVDRTIGIDMNPDSETYGEVIFYRVSPATLGTFFDVHCSRCLIIDGIDIPEEEKRTNNNWGLSFYQATQYAIKRLSVLYGNVENIMDDFVTSTLSMSNLQDMIAAGQEDIIKTRLELLDLSKHIINTRLLDERETFQKQTSSVAGIADIMHSFQTALSCVTGEPLTLLFGQSTKGLASKGETDIRFWYDSIAAEQEEKLLPVDERLLYLIQKSKEGPTKGMVNDDWSVEYLPLWQPTEDEQAETRKKVAESDKIYIENSVLTPEEVAINRFGGAEYSTETILEEEDLKARRKSVEEETPTGGAE